MIKSMWTYPWDILDVGQGALYKDLFNRAQVNSISLALSYHAGLFVQSRSPARKVYFPEDGTVYFNPDTHLYRNQVIQPKPVSNVGECDTLLRSLSADRKREGFRLSAWFVCLHNSRIGFEHPEVTMVNAYGDHYYYGLCPSNDHVRTYITTALQDLTYSHDIDAVELESLNFMTFPHGYHHEKDAVGLNDYESFLMSLCFCEACKHKASQAGIDVEDVKRFVQSELRLTFERDIPIPSAPEFGHRGMEYFAANKNMSAFLRWRVSVVTSLAHEVRQAMNPATDMVLITSPVENTWKVGIDVTQVAKFGSHILICCYGTDAARVEADMAKARECVPPDTKLLTGLRVIYPEVHSGAELADKVHRALDTGADGINFYNYGLIPVQRLDWVAEACC